MTDPDIIIEVSKALDLLSSKGIIIDPLRCHPLLDIIEVLQERASVVTYDDIAIRLMKKVLESLYDV